MNDPALVVSFTALQQASGDIQKALNTIDSQLGHLERDAAPLVATWDSEARQAYEQRQARWWTAARNLQTMLRDIKLAVDDSLDDYLTTEKRNVNLFQ